MQTAVAGIPERISESEVPVWRILGRNPGPMTGPGTNSYLIGESRLSLIDPGPRDSDQLRSFLEAIGGRKLEYILATHTHGDHSPGRLSCSALPAPNWWVCRRRSMVIMT